jgi:hypothetical protein
MADTRVERVVGSAMRSCAGDGGGVASIPLDDRGGERHHGQARARDGLLWRRLACQGGGCGVRVY